ncbi:hypothetical protein AVCANL279_07460 [Campylobacter canadensis]|uniref:hypothetical protein n=1 Tax=Campylobacter canadensis TaxID=449520 RepID=UPI001CD034AC|nr:hypothetical protein [Campylobacter canadensis]MBZ7995148.1 hypothetical protein [Campylobacter canadensis]MBZ7997156.1 hypothetical protein [Campylobacter canadensis]MBZ8002658.1 hypothetical protein [Campylobacter canadensis]MBZ8003824.1 hypothetical protein [Campylobacter canadensis]
MSGKEFNERIKKLGLSVSEFAELTGLTKDAVYGWSRNSKTTPDWVKSWLDNYEKALLLENIKNAFSQAFLIDKK